MNAGRIGNMCVPVSPYDRPRTRFVAGFIGRTNCVGALREADAVAFDGFAVPAARVNGELEGHSGALTFSVRPQNIALHGAAPSGGGAAVPGKIVQRAYLGEFWDYVVAPDASALRLRVVAPPREAFDAGQSVWIEFDPDRMTALA